MEEEGYEAEVLKRAIGLWSITTLRMLMLLCMSRQSQTAAHPDCRGFLLAVIVDSVNNSAP
jgi:hypothetical protein